MLKTIASRPWVCSSCVWRRGHRRFATATSNATASIATHEAPGAQRDDQTLRQIFDSPRFWQEFSNGSRKSIDRRNVGLFRNRYLTEARGFEEFTDITLRRASKIIERILLASSVEEYKSMARDFDKLSDLLCRVIDLSDFVRATHPDERMQAAATQAYATMFEYMNILNTTPQLNEQLGVALDNQEISGSWSEEERTVARILRKDFAKSAINLSQAQREKFVRLSQDISEVGADFVSLMQPETREISFSSSRLMGMDPLLVRSFTRWGSVKLPTAPDIAHNALQTVIDEGTRKDIYMASRTTTAEQIGRLEDLLRKRAELAKLSGFEDYNSMALEDKMAKKPSSVNMFLQALSKDNEPRAKQEIADLVKLKSQDPKATGPWIQPWDRKFYQRQIVNGLRSKTRNIDFLSAFLSVGTVMQGLSRLFTRLYGVRFVAREAEPGETWNDDVRCIDVISETDGHVAVLYCDLFSRPGKSPNPAHFTLRCSREIRANEVQEMAEVSSHLFSSAEEAANDGMALSTASGCLKQLPTIALICDFHSSSHNSVPALLSFQEMETLFHEMGHAIHSILGRTSLHNVSGTRCATDFAELPSVLMEHFAADASVLSLFARHYQTDEPLPYDMVADKISLDNRFEGLDAENRILLALLDQSLHSDAPFKSNFSSTEIFHQLQQKHSSVGPDPAGTNWQGFFGHLFGYGSTYYSYLFDQVLAERIWKQVFKGGQDAGGISRVNGERMKENVLKWGGGRDPWRCLADVLEDGRVQDGDEKAMAIVGSWRAKDVDREIGRARL